MPKISELPASQEMTGTEMIAIVQDGETRKITLADLLDEPPVIKCRWVNSNYANSFINYSRVLVDALNDSPDGLSEEDEVYYINWNGQPLKLNGKAYYPKNKPYTVIWAYEIELEDLPIDPVTEEQDVVFDGEESYQSLELGDGSWLLKATGGNFSGGGRIKIFVDGTLKYTLTSVNDEYVIKPRYGTISKVSLSQNMPFAANVHVSRTARYLINGEVPSIEFCGDQIAISSENLPCSCHFMITASLYDNDGNNIGVYFGLDVRIINITPEIASLPD